MRHFTAGRIYRSPEQAAEFLTRIPSIVDAMQDCDVVLYQAGADPHVDDPLGGWLIDEQLAYRDQAVFDAARALGIPAACGTLRVATRNPSRTFWRFIMRL